MMESFRKMQVINNYKRHSERWNLTNPSESTGKTNSLALLDKLKHLQVTGCRSPTTMYGTPSTSHQWFYSTQRKHKYSNQ